MDTSKLTLEQKAYFFEEYVRAIKDYCAPETINCPPEEELPILQKFTANLLDIGRKINKQIAANEEWKDEYIEDSSPSNTGAY